MVGNGSVVSSSLKFLNRKIVLVSASNFRTIFASLMLAIWCVFPANAYRDYSYEARAHKHMDNYLAFKEANKKRDSMPEVLSSGLVGDQISYYDGSVSFYQEYINLPGNSDLPVIVGRNIDLNDRYRSVRINHDVPRVSTTVVKGSNGLNGWSLGQGRGMTDDGRGGHLWPLDRCSGFDQAFTKIKASVQYANADAVVGDSVTGFFDPPQELRLPYTSYGGLQIHIHTLGGAKERLVRGAKPKGLTPEEAESISLSTKNNWKGRCVDGASDGGEGFEITSPDGHTYIFDQIVYRSKESNILYSTPKPGPYKNFLDNDTIAYAEYETKYAEALVSEIRDIHGNWVKYHYTEDSNKLLVKIESHDGRLIEYEYTENGGVIVSASNLNDGLEPRVWRFNGSNVELPDGRVWGNAGISDPSVFDTIYDCVDNIYTYFNVVHPSGAIVKFEFGRVYHLNVDVNSGPTYGNIEQGKDIVISGMEDVYSCFNTHNVKINSDNRVVSFTPRPGDASLNTSSLGARGIGLKRKTITLPSGEEYVWSYNYEYETKDELMAAEMPYGNLTWTKETAPDGTVRKRFYKRSTSAHDIQNGSVQKLEVYESGTAAPVEIVTNKYTGVSINSGTGLVGGAGGGIGTKTLLKTAEVKRTEDLYTVNYQYGIYGQPTKITKSTSLSEETRVVDIEYEHIKDKWILGLPKKITKNTKIFDEYTYDDNGLLQTHSRFGEPWASFTHYSSVDAVDNDQFGLLKTYTDVLGEETTFSDYKIGKSQEILQPDGTRLYQTVNAFGDVTSITDAEGNTTEFEYDLNSWLRKILPPAELINSGDASVTDIAYNFVASPDDANRPLRLERILTQTDPETLEDLKVTQHFDAMMRPYWQERIDLSRPDSVSRSATRYDYANRVEYQSYPTSDVITQDSNITPDLDGIHTEYDGLGRVTEVHADLNGGEQASTYTYYEAENKIRVKDAENKEVTTTFLSFGSPVDNPSADGVMMPIKVDRPLGADMHIGYDDWNNKRFEIYKLGDVSLSASGYVYDDRLRLKEAFDPHGDVTKTFYDRKDRVIAVRDGEGRTTRSVYDEMDRVRKVIKAWDGTTDEIDDWTNTAFDCLAMTNNYSLETGTLQHCYQENEYDNNGNLEQVKDARGNATSYTYDALNRSTVVTFPDASTHEIVDYDVFGNPREILTRADQTLKNNFDALGRLMASSTPDRDSVYAYDAAARRTCASVYAAGHLGSNFANLDGVDCAANDNNMEHRTVYNFDVAGRMMSEVSSMGGGLTPKTVGYDYDKLNNRLKIEWPDGMHVQYEYDDNYRLENVKKNSSALLAHYDYDEQDRLLKINYGNNVSSTSLNWEIDSDLESLTHSFSNDNDVSFSYGYDKSAKLKGESESIPGWLYKPSVDPKREDYAEANELNQYTDVNDETLTHDLNGNRTYYSANGGLNTPHDSENRLTQVGDDINYSYDADGRRIEKETSDAIVRFVHAGDMEIAEYEGDTLLRRYIPGHSVDQRVAMIELENDGTTERSTHFYHANRLGSVQAMVNASTGAVTDRYVYSPFGVQNLVADDPIVNRPSGNPFRYTGRRFDAESGLYYYRARYYDSELGRFLQTDPVGYADQMNMYAYTHNDPLNYTDPTGMVCKGEGEESECTFDRIKRDGEWRDFTDKERNKLLENKSDLLEKIEKLEKSITEAYRLAKTVGDETVTISGDRERIYRDENGNRKKVTDTKVSGNNVAEVLSKYQLTLDPANSSRKASTFIGRETIEYGAITLKSSRRAQIEDTIHEGMHPTKAAIPWNTYTLSRKFNQGAHQNSFNSAANRMIKKGRQK